MKTLADGLHGIEDVLKKTAASLFRDAVEDGSEDDPLEVENAALRAHAERVGEANDRLVVENAALRAKIAELEHFLSPKP